MLTVRRLADLSPAEREALLARSAADVSEVYEAVRAIVEDVRLRGDQALLDSLDLKTAAQTLGRAIDPAEVVVGPAEIEAAYAALDDEVIAGLREAAANIHRFHDAQVDRRQLELLTEPGLRLGRLIRTIPAVGCYAPGGTAFLPSSVLMTVIPAKAAGVGRVAVVSPPRPDLSANPASLVAADIAGADEIYKLGGPWAVAALAFGTATLKRVDKIVGPGNKYVTAAKLLVFGRVGIDSPAGPSEALILADQTARPDWLAVDFLSQTEHDADSGAVLVSTDRAVAEETVRLINERLPGLARREQIESALRRHSHVLVAADLDEAVAFANDYAAEHLQIVTAEPRQVLTRIDHAGSIFLGPYSPVPAGDYASGTNHVLPTGGLARAFSGLSVDDFIKKPTYQELSRAGLASLRRTVTALAKAEGLPLHAEAVEVRFKD